MNLKNIWTVFKREVGAYFNSPIAYIYLIVFVAFVNGLFMSRFFLLGRAEMRVFFDELPLILLIFIPVVSMRLWAEDRKENTFELLMTFPMRAIELTLGKFCASFVFYVLALLSTAAIPVMLFAVGRPDAGVMASAYLGAALLGALFLAIGIFVSGLTKEQIVAFVVTVLSCFLLYFLGVEFFASLIDGWVPGLGAFLMRTLGTAGHLEGFLKGVIDVKDIAYFVVGAAVFLLLNSFYLDSRYRPKARLLFGAAVVVCLAIVMAANGLLADVSWGRFDATEGKIYTVSPATKRILRSLPSVVFITVYLTPAEKMPTFLKTLEQELVDKLKELRIASAGKLEYKTVYIEAAHLLEQKTRGEGQEREPTLEEKLQAKGILPFQVESIDRDELGVKLVYAALTIDYKEKMQEALPRIFPDTVQDIEYMLMSRIAKLAREKKPRVVLFAPLERGDMAPEMVRLLASMGETTTSFQDEYAMITQLLNNNGYATGRVALTADSGIPEDTDVLLVFKPRGLNDRQLYEINKFLHQGGAAIIAAQGFECSFRIKPPQGIEILPIPQDLSINKLLANWGFKIDDQMLMDESSDLISISTGERSGPMAGNMPIRAPNQILVRQEFMSRRLPLMSRQSPFMYLWGSVLTVAADIIEGAKLDYDILFTSTKRSWRVPFRTLGIFGGAAPVSAQDLAFPSAGSPGKFALGMMVTGPFPDTFAGKDVPPWPAKKGEEKPAVEAAKEPTVEAAKEPTVEAAKEPTEEAAKEPTEEGTKEPAEEGTKEPAEEGSKEPTEEAATDEALTPAPGRLILIGCAKVFSDILINNPPNLNLFANMVDGLALGEDLIQIRAKMQSGRQINRLTDAQKVGWRFAVVAVVPLCWTGFALARFFLRRKEKQFYQLARER